MSLFHRKIIILLVVMILQSCGFTPVYETADTVHGLSPNLQAVEVEEIGQGRSGQLLKAHLEDLFNPVRKEVDKLYKLRVDLIRKKEALLIEQDREINRYNIVITGHFVLKDIKGKTLYKGKSRIATSYSVVDSDFATLSAEEDTVKRVIGEMAKDIRFKISAFFLGKES